MVFDSEAVLPTELEYDSPRIVGMTNTSQNKHGRTFTIGKQWIYNGLLNL
jgi:hypothetical protein